MDPSSFVTVARLGRARGLKGEIFADGWVRKGNVPLRRVWLQRPDGVLLNQGEPFEVISSQPFKGREVLRLAGVDSVAAAEALTGSDVVVPRSERPPLDANEYYLADLAGCGVFDRASGRKLGEVAGWQELGGQVLLEVLPEGSGPGKAALVPFVRSICVEIDPQGRRIVVDPPEGLLDLD